MSQSGLKLDLVPLTQLPEVRAVAKALQRRWNVWIGLVTRAGIVLPILGRSDDRASGPDLPLCEQFKKRSDHNGSCSGSLTSWAGGDETRLKSCHAHLYAVVVPIGMDGSAGPSLFASGFVNAERHTDQAGAILNRAGELGMSRSKTAGLIDSAPRLRDGERSAIRTLLEAMAESMRSSAQPSPLRSEIRYDYSHIVGQSPEMLHVFSLLDRIVASDSTVLIEGENGTGKELVARAIHNNSRRRERAFVTQNCSDINDNLLESELFGHRRGAFTGAIADKRGLFERADGGTLFLDEVGDMSPSMQVKLLRVLQESTFLPVGDTVTRTVDVRVIAATNRNLRQMVSDGSFREDLFYRLNVISLVVPPLRRRQGDIPLLLEHFLGMHARTARAPVKKMSDEVIGILTSYHWPGNVRELRHEIERLVVLSGDEPVIIEDLISPRILQAAGLEPSLQVSSGDVTLPRAVEVLERQMIATALEQTGWNKTQAAKKLGISRRNLIRKVQCYNLEPPA